MLKNRKYPQKLMFTATRELTDMPLEVLVYSVVVGGSNMQHTDVNLIKISWAPRIAGILYSKYIVALDLFCCHHRRS